MRVVDLVGAGVVEVFALEPDLGAAALLGQPLGEVERGGPADVVRSRSSSSAWNAGSLLGLVVLRGQLVEGVHQRLGDVPPPNSPNRPRSSGTFLDARAVATEDIGDFHEDAGKRRLSRGISTPSTSGTSNVCGPVREERRHPVDWFGRHRAGPRRSRPWRRCRCRTRAGRSRDRPFAGCTSPASRSRSRAFAATPPPTQSVLRPVFLSVCSHLPTRTSTTAS